MCCSVWGLYLIQRFFSHTHAYRIFIYIRKSSMSTSMCLDCKCIYVCAKNTDIACSLSYTHQWGKQTSYELWSVNIGVPSVTYNTTFQGRCKVARDGANDSVAHQITWITLILYLSKGQISSVLKIWGASYIFPASKNSPAQRKISNFHLLQASAKNG